MTTQAQLMMMYTIVKFVWLEFGLLSLCNCSESFRWGDVSANRYRARGTLSLPNIRTPGVSGLVTSWIFKLQFYYKILNILGFSGLFVCLFNMCNSKRTKMISSTWGGDFTRPTSRILLHWTIICLIWIYYWTRRLSAMTLNCTFADYSCSVLYL